MPTQARPRPAEERVKDRMPEIESVGLMGFKGSRETDKEFSGYIDKEIRDGKLKLDKKFIMGQLERGSSAMWAMVAAPYIRDKLLADGVKPEEADWMVQDLFMKDLERVKPGVSQDLAVAADPKTSAEAKSRALSGLAQAFEGRRTSGVNFYESTKPLMESHEARKEFIQDYRSQGHEDEGTALASFLFFRSQDKGIQDSRKKEGEATRADGLTALADARQRAGGSDVPPTAGRLREDGVDVSLLLDQAGIDPNTPQGQRMAKEVLTSPGVRLALSQKSSRALLVLSVMDVMDEKKSLAA
ncbi:hypothetical protein ACFLRF_03930 [Candidatus Altiarchaeota archaeon]